MDIDKLYDMYKTRIKDILNQYMMATISDRSYDIHGFNLINRLLIYIQNKYTTSVKSDTGWYIVGREVRVKSSPIWIIENVIETKYIDSETSEVIENLDLNANDIVEAVKLGIIKKSKSIKGLKAVPLFNIKDTTIYDKDSYRLYKINENTPIRVSVLLKIASKDFGITCNKSQVSYYDVDDDILYIGKDAIRNKIKAIAEAIASKVVLEDAIDNDYVPHMDKDTIDVINNICESFIIESIVSYCDKEYSVEDTVYSSMNKIDFENQYNIEAFITELSAAYDLVEEVICLINPDNHKINESTLRKAAELLNILEANDAITRLKG